ncbi:MAG: hypothetical protein Q8O52_07130 [Sulfuritalea sp.]|nr:hypothetical protein [Sulfuritalea sp.]
MSEATEKILQIISADGWEAMFEDEDNVSVVCFALVQSTDEQGVTSSEVRPMGSIGDAIEFCDEYPNYQGITRAADDALDDYDEDEEEEEEEEE